MNIKKIGFSALAGSLVAFSSATAGEMSVTGTAALYMTATDETGKTTFSNSDQVNFSGSTELDNGMTVTFALELDGDESDDGAIDSHSVTIDTNGMGTIKFAGHGGGAVLGSWDDLTPNAYEEAWDGLAPSGGADEVINGFDANDQIRYTSPSMGGVTFEASFLPSNTTHNGGVYTDMGIKIAPEMVEGLTIYYAMGDEEATAGTEFNHSTLALVYAFGPVTVGYQASETDATAANDTDETTTIGISYAVSDEFSVSYNKHDFDAGNYTSDEEYTGISASYTMGGITLAGHMNTKENAGGSANAADVDGYEVALTFAF